MTLEERARELHLRIGEALEYSAKNPEEPSCVVDLIEKALRSAQEEMREKLAIAEQEIINIRSEKVIDACRETNFKVIEKLKMAEEALNEIAVEWGEDIDEVAISCGRSFATIAAVADEALKKIRGEDDQT